MPLRLSGAARVAHNYLPIYVVALYVGRARVDAGMLGRGLVPFRFVVHWQASATGDHEAYWREQLQAQLAAPADRERLGPAIDKLAAALGGGARGADLLVDYHPERGDAHRPQRAGPAGLRGPGAGAPGPGALDRARDPLRRARPAARRARPQVLRGCHLFNGLAASLGRPPVALAGRCCTAPKMRL